MILPLGTAGNCSWFIPHSPLPDSPTPAECCCSSLQERSLQPGAISYCWSAHEREHQTPTSQPAWPKSSPSILAPHPQMTHEMKSPCCSAPSLCSQPHFMNNSKTNIFVLQLLCQDKQGAKLGANCNTTDFGRQPSFQLLIYFPPRSPSFWYFWADHNTHQREQTPAWLSACPWWMKASPHSLLSHSFQHHFITGKPDKPVAAVFLF